MRKKIFQNQSGLTLIEILVAVTIFSMIVGAVITSFISAIRSQKRILAYQELFDQISYVMEYMSRTLRMAVKETTGGCLSSPGLNYESPCLEFFTPSCVKFKRLIGLERIGDGEETFCESFYLNGSQIRNSIVERGIDLPLTSPYLNVTNFGINLKGEWEPWPDLLQPRVTFVVDIETKLEPPIKLKLQTTLSQRSFDVDEIPDETLP